MIKSAISKIKGGDIDMTKFETGIYNLYCILTFGGAYLTKLIIKKAMLESK